MPNQKGKGNKMASLERDNDNHDSPVYHLNTPFCNIYWQAKGGDYFGMIEHQKKAHKDCQIFCRKNGCKRRFRTPQEMLRHLPMHDEVVDHGTEDDDVGAEDVVENGGAGDNGNNAGNQGGNGNDDGGNANNGNGGLRR